MKKVLSALIICSFLMTPVALYADNHGGKCKVCDEKLNKKVTKSAKKLTRQLDLNKEQAGQVEYLLREKYLAKKEAKKRLWAEKNAIGLKFFEDFSDILDEDQRAEWTDMYKDYKKKAKKKKKCCKS